VKHENRTNDGDMTIQVFLHRLEQRSLVSQEVLADLRKLVAQARTPVSAYRLAKVLVDNRVVSDANVRSILDEELAPQATQLRRAEEIPSRRSKQVKAVEDDDLSFAPDKKPNAESKKQQAASNAAGSSLFDEELPPMSADLANIPSGGIGDLWNDPNFTALLGETNPLESTIPGKKGYFKKLLDRIKRHTGGKLPWPWIGAGAAGLLILLLIVLWIANRADPDEMLVPADALYEKGSYAEAIPKYDEYLESYSNREAAGRAFVRRGLAQLRLSLSSAANGVAALDAVKQIVAPISQEDTFTGEGGVLLADLLPQVGERLVQEGPKRPAPDAIARLREILTLSEEWIPKEERPRERLGRIEAALRLMQYQASAKEELEKTVDAIHQAITAKDFSAAYHAYRKFQKAFPALSDSEELLATMSEITEAERLAVAWVAKPRTASAAEPEKHKESVILAYRRFDSTPPETEGRAIFATAKGAVYGLNAVDGKILWRKFVGLDIDGPLDGISPQLVDSQPSSDVVLMTSQRGAIERAEASTGRVRWRHVLGENYCSEPVVAGDRIFVATPRGRIVVIDAASGNSPGYVQLPQSLPAAPAVDVVNKLMFQAANHDNLFVVGLNDWRCRQVFSLGHTLGTIAVPPVICGDELLASINDQPAHSAVYHLLLNKSAKEPLQKVASISEAKLNSGRQFCIEATSFSAQSQEDMPGTVVAATDAKTGRIYWQTHLAAPLVGEPWIDSEGKTNVATALGMVYRLDTIDSEKTTIVDRPAAMPPCALKRPVTDLVRIGKDICVLTGGPGSDLVLAYDRKEAKKQLHLWLSPGRISCPPIALGEGLLVPSEVGQVYLLDPLTGKPRALPFQPPLQNGKLPIWCSPAAANERECVIADGNGNRYRLQIVEKPVKHLASVGGTGGISAKGIAKQDVQKQALIGGFDGVLYPNQLP